MTHQLLFVQGGGSGTHDNWDKKLVESLERELGPDYAVRYPRMPHEADPAYARWKAALTRAFARLGDGAMVVGHSIGGTILLRTLADEPARVPFGGIFLIAAPFVGKGGWESEDIASLADVGRSLPEQTPIFLYHGRNDHTAPVKHLQLYARAIPRAIVRRLAGRDHQLNSDLAVVAADIRSSHVTARRRSRRSRETYRRRRLAGATV